MKEAYVDSIDNSVFKKEFAKGREKFKENNPTRYYKDMEKYTKKIIEKGSKNIEGHYGFDISSENGKNYLMDMNYCLEYALENRKTMINVVFDGIYEQKECKIEQFINRNHNHAELKGGYVIHRKGATHAEKDMLGVIPANMRDGSFIVKGLGNEDSMCSSSHGAGRVLSRSSARKTLDLFEFENEMKKITNNHTSKMIDESPKAYKDIFRVMELQKDLVEVIDRSIPFLNIKG